MCISAPLLTVSSGKGKRKGPQHGKPRYPNFAHATIAWELGETEMAMGMPLRGLSRKVEVLTPEGVFAHVERALQTGGDPGRDLSPDGGSRLGPLRDPTENEDKEQDNGTLAGGTVKYTRYAA